MNSTVDRAAELIESELKQHPVVPDVPFGGQIGTFGGMSPYELAKALDDADLLTSDERAFINGLPLEDKVNHQHTRFAEHVADAVVNNRDFPYTTPQGIKADSRDVAIEAISAAFAQLWRHDVIDPDALVAFLDKEVADEA